MRKELAASGDLEDQSRAERGRVDGDPDQVALPREVPAQRLVELSRGRKVDEAVPTIELGAAINAPDRRGLPVGPPADLVDETTRLLDHPPALGSFAPMLALEEHADEATDALPGAHPLRDSAVSRDPRARASGSRAATPPREETFAVTSDATRWASVGMGIGSLFFVSLVNLGIFAIATRLWPYRLLDLGQGALGWSVAMIGWDLAYYWNHRLEHENRLLWACHVNHHSSRYYNLSTALRQPWTPLAGWVFYPGLALVGVAPVMIMVSAGLNLVYQYWVHTEAIDRMPRWFEAVFNTPSHHRVHHGSNPEYLDKNYAGIFIVWDRLLGTFEPERAPVSYGLTKNIETFSLWQIAFHEYASLGHDLRAARTGASASVFSRTARHGAR